MPVTLRPRTVLRLSGDGMRDWLGNLLTNTLDGTVTFAALLTPQGKIIADMFVTDRDDHLLIDTPVAMGELLRKRLMMYRLRAPITIEDVSKTHFVHALWGDAADDGNPDPRLGALGNRLITDYCIEGSGDYDAHRLMLGVPDSEWDFGSSTTFPMDTCMDQLNGVNYSKGCFVGQEVVSRMKRRSDVRKRMKTLRLGGSAECGDPLKLDERTVGHVLHVHGDLAMALVRVDRIADVQAEISVRDQPVEIVESAFDRKELKD